MIYWGGEAFDWDAAEELDALIATECEADAAKVDFVTFAWRMVETIAICRELGKDFDKEKRDAQNWLKAHDLTPAKVRKLKPRPKTLFD